MLLKPGHSGMLESLSIALMLQGGRAIKKSNDSDRAFPVSAITWVRFLNYKVSGLRPPSYMLQEFLQNME
jgi:hypothetical protein